MVVGLAFAQPISSSSRLGVRFSTLATSGNATPFVDVAAFEANVHGLGVPFVDRLVFSPVVTLVSISKPSRLEMEDDIVEEISHMIKDFSKRASIF